MFAEGVGKKQKTLQINEDQQRLKYLGRDLNPYILADTGF